MIKAGVVSYVPPALLIVFLECMIRPMGPCPVAAISRPQGARILARGACVAMVHGLFSLRITMVSYTNSY